MPALMLNGVNYSGIGGGGNANEQVLTWAEYCALTPEEKMNDTTYYINDINGDGQSFQPVIYSEEEREIGVWTDGKPLYQKTLHFTTTSSANTYTRVPHNISNADTIFIHDAFVQNSSTSFILSGYKGDAAANEIIGLLNHIDNTFDYKCGASAINSDACITLQYTKTTDQPGSGTWTPQGVPAVHYDGNEKVVGTWFGETLYEKTITYNATGQMREGTYTLGTISVADKMMIESAFVYNNDDGRVYFLPYSNGSSTSSLLTDVSKNIVLRVKSDSWGAYNTFYVTVRYTKSSS